MRWVVMSGMMILICHSIFAQMEGYVGRYVIGTMNDDNELVIEENCWTGDPDGVQITFDDASSSYQISFHSFHSASLQIEEITKENSSISIKGFDPDAQVKSTQSYRLEKNMHRDLSYVMLTENEMIEYLLIPIERTNNLEYVQCIDKNNLDSPGLCALSKQLFTSIAELNQKQFDEFTNDSGFRFMYNTSEENLLTISQLFENAGFASWLRFVRGRASDFIALDTYTPFDHCSEDLDRPTLMIKRYNEEEESHIDIHVWDNGSNPYRMVIGCEIKEKWLKITHIIVDVCAN